MTATPARGRTIAIGDVHGCLAAFDALLDAVQPAPDDLLVTLGDYVDRGPDSRGVIERLLELSRRCRLVTLLGNHDAQMLAAMRDPNDMHRWLAFGGLATLYSYNQALRPEGVPAEHLDFLRACLHSYETDSHLFIHANYREQTPISEQDDDVLLWLSLKNSVPGPHVSGKTAIVGHTAQRNYQVLDLGHLVCIDTGCCYGGLLTAMDVERREYWQVDKTARLVARPGD